MGIVVEAAHQAGIDLERDAGGRQPILDRREEIPARLVQVIGERGSVGVDRLVGLVLAVEDTQRIALQAALRILGQLGDVTGIVVDQHLAIDAAALGIAERIDLEHAAFEDAETIEDVSGHRDHLDVGGRLGRAQHLEVDLMELTLAALLRPLVAKHRAGGEELQRQLLAEFAVGHEGPADARRARRVFRPQGERFTAAILECVHLLGHDVGRLADAARKKLGELEDRRRHLAIAVEARHVARRVDDMGEAPILVGKKIVRAAHGLHFAHGKSP